MYIGDDFFMCGIVGFTNYSGSINNPKTLLENMTNKLYNRGMDGFGYYESSDNNVFLGHRRLAIIDINGGKQPMTFENEKGKYTIIYNGEIYNYNQLRSFLKDNGVALDTRSDTEMVIKAYMLLGAECLSHFEGIFAFAIYEQNSGKIFLARDHIGVKPLFYTELSGDIFFASEIKGILEYSGISRVVDKRGVCELLGLGPARNVGSTVFRDIKEVKPGHYITFDGKNIKEVKYYKIKSGKHVDDIERTVERVRYLVEKSVTDQLIADVDVGIFLSGGIDSSIITAIVARNMKDSKDKIKTFSVDYVDNDINFKANDFQPKRDNGYIDLMINRYNLNHKYIVIDNRELYNALYDAMVARDMPSMADIDSSLLLFCKEVSKEVKVALSGEFADEIFCGYPWFYREDALNSNTFPWSINLKQRQDIINKEIAEKINIKEYVNDTYKVALEEVPLYNTDNEQDTNMKKLSYLTMSYFGAILLDRSDRMSMANNLEIRVPFTDYNLVEYVYNIPWGVKNYKDMEKGILREAFRDILPEEIANRKKSPYPKTYNPTYTKMVTDMLIKIVQNKDNRMKELVDIDYVKGIIEGEEKEYSRPWFGQLMTRTQLMAYLIQLEMWLKEYEIDIEV